MKGVQMFFPRVIFLNISESHLKPLHLPSSPVCPRRMECRIFLLHTDSFDSYKMIILQYSCYMIVWDISGKSILLIIYIRICSLSCRLPWSLYFVWVWFCMLNPKLPFQLLNLFITSLCFFLSCSMPRVLPTWQRPKLYLEVLLCMICGFDNPFYFYLDIKYAHSINKYFCMKVFLLLQRHG